MKQLKRYLIVFWLLPTLGMMAQSPISIVPKPVDIHLFKSVYKTSSPATVYIDKDAALSIDYVSEVLKEAGINPTFIKEEKKAKIVFKLDVDPTENPAAYKLKVKGKIQATGNSDRALLYALQTLRQLSDGKSIQECEISDVPAFSWRAFMLDESRHFQGMDEVKKILNEMARLKFNVFHWHLVDDTGWRIEIKKYPLLTELGSKRNFSSLNENSNLTPADWDKNHSQRAYYTQEEIKEVIEYAKTRGIDIMPEIELPGHASASIYAYPWLGTSSRKENKPVYGDLYNVIDPNMERFFKDVLDEVVALFPFRIVHIGGDEANYTHWQQCEAINEFMKTNNLPTYTDLQLWSINRISKYLTSKGSKMMGWNEITGDNIRNEAHVQSSKAEKLAAGTIVHFWDGDVSLVNKAIEKGYYVVNSHRHETYLDYPYEVTPFEKAYNFNPIPQNLAEKDKDKILGFGCQMWGEYTPNTERLYFQIYPRIAALAESGWTPAENKNYDDFRNRFKKIELLWKVKGYLKNQVDKY